MLARLHLPRGTAYYQDALEGLVRVNADLYRAGRLPSIYAAGVQYEGYDPQENWRNVVEVLRDKKGDCEDLASARAGELRANGEQANVIIRRTGPHMTHALVQRSDGSIEDPSRRLGMGAHRSPEQIGGESMARYPGYDSVGGFLSQLKPTVSKFLPKFAAKRAMPRIRVLQSVPVVEASADERAEVKYDGGQDEDGDDFETYNDIPIDDGDFENWADERLMGECEQIGADVSTSPELSWTVNRTATGWQGTVRVPLDMGRALLVSRVAPTKDAAAKKALTAASSVLDSDIAKALIPPQAQAALNVLRSPQAQKAAKVALKAAKALKFW